ncbi:M20 family metallopeptidase [Paenarthrobacter sp. Z7-10]|nr:M20 family metallopeptidase [Paenarthrobacter sp. Z7-10]
MHAVSETSGSKSRIAQELSLRAEQVVELSTAIAEDPELSFEEHRASAAICTLLGNAGFIVERPVAELATAFTATAGTGELTVGICVEYDALPGIGHACGHNLIAGASVAAALGLLPVVDELGITLKVIGTPAEEHGAGKVVLLNAGVFDDVTVAMMVHPMQEGASCNPAGTKNQAVGRYRATFRGTPSHAAVAPHLGVNAADAAVISQVAVGLLRQQIPGDHRIAMFIAEAGHVTNIIPDLAVVEFECRALTLPEYEALLTRVRNCFEAGALATGTTLEIEPTEPLYEPLIQDEVMGNYWSQNMSFLGHNAEYSPGPGGGSTDMGNVSQVVPSIQPWVSIPGATAPPHSHGFAAATNAPAAYRAMLDAGLAMAWTVSDIMADPAQVQQYLKAFAVRRGAQTCRR